MNRLSREDWGRGGGVAVPVTTRETPTYTASWYTGAVETFDVAWEDVMRFQYQLLKEQRPHPLCSWLKAVRIVSVKHLTLPYNLARITVEYA